MSQSGYLSSKLKPVPRKRYMIKEFKEHSSEETDEIIAKEILKEGELEKVLLEEWTTKQVLEMFEGMDENE